MSQPQYIDISAANQPLSDWNAYKAWSAQWDGVSRVAIKVSEGTGYVSGASHAQDALRAGIDSIIWYHYARPDLNPGYQGAQNEVNYFRAHVPAWRSGDIAMLDYEGFPGVPDDAWVPDWAWDWLHLFINQANVSYARTTIYSYADFIARKLQYEPLAAFPLFYAIYNATKTPAPLPAAPVPWTKYTGWQFSNHQPGVPGVVGYVDCNLWTGPSPAPSPPPLDVPGAIAAIQAAQSQLSVALKKLGG